MRQPLIHQHCTSSSSKLSKLSAEEFFALQDEIPGWNIDATQTALSRECVCATFQESLARVNRIGALAESEGQYPDIMIEQKKIKITLSTPAVQGISRNDVILAAKINTLL